jgi:hypothetical protein
MTESQRGHSTEEATSLTDPQRDLQELGEASILIGKAALQWVAPRKETEVTFHKTPGQQPDTC